MPAKVSVGSSYSAALSRWVAIEGVARKVAAQKINVTTLMPVPSKQTASQPARAYTIVENDDPSALPME